MKTFLPIVLASAMALATASEAFAYVLSPSDTSARLRGTLTFSPQSGGAPISCKVVMDLRISKKSFAFVRSIVTPKHPGWACWM